MEKFECHSLSCGCQESEFLSSLNSQLKDQESTETYNLQVGQVNHI